MKKRIIALFAAIFAVWAFAGCASTSDAEPKELRVERLVLPDGTEAEVHFFESWFGEANPYQKQLRKNAESEGKKWVRTERASSDTALGCGEVVHRADENSDIRRICQIMKECGATYGIAAADFGTRTRVYMLTYFEKGRKGNSDVEELQNYFDDYFSEEDSFYRAQKR